MLKITRLTDYATVILTHMAKTPTQVFSAKSLAELLKMGPATVSKIMKMLSAQELVGATRGAEGGYRLLKAPEAVSVIDILVAMEGPVAITECTLMGHRCGQAHDCGVQGHWQRMNQVIMTALSKVTLADLVRPSAMNPFTIPASSLVVGTPHVRPNELFVGAPHEAPKVVGAPHEAPKVVGAPHEAPK